MHRSVSCLPDTDAYQVNARNLKCEGPDHEKGQGAFRKLLFGERQQATSLQSAHLWQIYHQMLAKVVPNLAKKDAKMGVQST